MLLNTQIQSLKVWLKSVVPMAEIQNFFLGDCFLLAHPVYITSCTKTELASIRALNTTEMPKFKSYEMRVLCLRNKQCSLVLNVNKVGMQSAGGAAQNAQTGMPNGQLQVIGMPN